MNAPTSFFPSASAGADVRAFFPGIVSARFHETWDFYTEQLGFRTISEWDTYVHLEHPSGAQLSILREETDGYPAELISATDGRGLWLTVEVPDADDEHERLLAAGVAALTPPEEKPWGDRQFTVRDPNGILIFIIQRADSRREAVAELATVP